MEIKDSVKSTYHKLLRENKFYSSLLEPDFKVRLENFLHAWEPIRAAENRIHIPFDEYPQLPFAPSVKQDFEWTWRCLSLTQLLPFLEKNKTQNILEIGSWNGWLSNQLCALGNDVLALDFFSDERDGLQSKKHYSQHWKSLQCNVYQTHFLEAQFEVIIVNHCLQFCPEPLAFCRELQKLLLPGGKIFLLGLNFYQNPMNKIKAVDAYKKAYKLKHNFTIFLQETKAYLDFNDKKEIEKLGFKLYKQKGMLLRNLYSSLFPAKPSYFFGVYEKTVLNQ